MTCWMINTTRENFEITRDRGFKLLGIDTPNRRKASQMVSGDRLVFYVRDDRRFAATATVKGKTFQNGSRIWKHHSNRERFRNRVNIELDVLPDEESWVDARQVGPTMEYVKRWPPEMWDMAFFGMVHIISKRDFDLLEGELSRYIDDEAEIGDMTDEDEDGELAEDVEEVEVAA